MVDNDALGKLFSWATAAWGALLLNAVALFKAWPNIMARINERRRDSAAERADDWQRLRAERDRLQQMLTVCETARIEWQARAVTAEATLLGMGMARQRVQEVEAAKRLTRSNDPKSE